jgi:integral membrane protein
MGWRRTFESDLYYRLTMKSIQLLRKLGLAEGISFVVLLFIAMPLKYFYEFPHAVKYVGWAHGLLFILYVTTAYYVKETRHQSFLKFIYAFVAALVPFGTFIYDRRLKKELALMGD